jgi:hypothetical protein
MREHPFDGDGTSSRANVPKALAGLRRQRRYADGTQDLLRELTVVLEHDVGQAIAAWNDERSRFGCKVQRYEIEIADIVHTKLVGGA